MTQARRDGQPDGMVEWWNGGMVEWWNGGMVEWWNGGMVEWWNGGMVGQAGRQAVRRAGSRVSYRQFHLLALRLHVEGPPSLHPLVFEERHLGHAAVRLQHAEGALLRGLGPAREVVQVEGERA